jgi:hypothetical protein
VSDRDPTPPEQSGSSGDDAHVGRDFFPAGDVYAAAGPRAGASTGADAYTYDDAEGNPQGALFPWPPPEGESFVTAFVETWKGAALTPGRFFRAMPEHGSVRSALLYYLPLGIAVSGANLFWSLTLTQLQPEQETVLSEMPVQAMHPLVEFFLAPLVLLASVFIAAAVTHGLLRLFGGATRSYAFTTRVFAFAYSPQVLAIVPVVGTVVGFIWMVGVAVIGLREGHRTSTGRVLAAVLIPVTLALILVAVAAFIATTGRLLTH